MMLTRIVLSRDRFAQHVEIDEAVCLQRQIGDPAAFLFQPLAGIETALCSVAAVMM